MTSAALNPAVIQRGRHRRRHTPLIERLPSLPSLRSLELAADVILTAILGMILAVAYAVVGAGIYYGLEEMARPNAAMWWAVGYGVLGVAGLYNWCARLAARWPR